MNRLEFEERIIRIVAGVAGTDAGTITLGTDLITDLGVDSASALVLLVELEDEFDVSLSDRAAANLRTVGDIVRYLDGIVKPQ